MMDHLGDCLLGYGHNNLKGHCPDCAHVFHTHAKLEKSTIFSSFSLTRNRIEIASTLEHTIVQYRDIGIVSANERSYLRGRSACMATDV